MTKPQTDVAPGRRGAVTYLTDALADKVAEAAKRDGRTVSQWLKRLIEDHFERELAQ